MRILVVIVFFCSVLICATPLRHEVVVRQQPPWGGYNLTTNYYQQVPNTGVTREYWLNIVNTTAALDGRQRQVLLVNGSFPGPTIVADWGDTVKVHVTNSLQNNGTSIHFHGLRLLNSNQMDGVASLTQCPIAPGQSYTYTWRAEQYGSSWYHSHFSVQAWDGVLGGITIHGPASASYDEDLGSFFLNDWDIKTADVMYGDTLFQPWTPIFEGGLLNGTNTYTLPNGTVVGKRLNLGVVPGKRYRLRLINAAMHTMFKFSIDSHNMTIIANDFVPIEPINTNFVGINSGQRYDVIVQANQPTASYWMRAIPQDSCSNNTLPNDIKGIFSYQGAAVGQTPNSTKQVYPDDHQCWDMNMYGYQTTPVLALNADVSQAYNVTKVATPLAVGSHGMTQWELGNAPMDIQWNDPTILETVTVSSPSWTPGQNVIEVDVPNQWAMLVVQNNYTLAHPLHIHGHDFWVLAQGIGTYDPATVKLNTQNPTRRDTATLPNTDTETGYIVLAWPADNPGTWLLHCHVGFHASEGFAMQIVERPAEIPALIDMTTLGNTCSAWNTYALDTDLAGSPYGKQNKAYFGEWESGV